MPEYIYKLRVIYVWNNTETLKEEHMESVSSRGVFIKIIFTVFAMSFPVESYSNPVYINAILKVLVESLTGPSLYFENQNEHSIYNYLDEKKYGLPTDEEQTGTLHLEKDDFQNNQNLLIGTSLSSINLMENGQLNIDLGIFFSLGNKTITFNDSFDNGYGGSAGYTAELNNSIAYKTDFMLHTQFNYRMRTKGIFSILQPFVAVDFRQISFRVHQTGRKWEYTSVNYNTPLAKSNETSIKIDQITDGNYNLIEPSFGVMVKNDDRSKLLLGVKYSGGAKSISTYLITTYDFGISTQDGKEIERNDGEEEEKGTNN